MSELWDNPLFPVEERLEMAVGAIEYHGKVMSAVTKRLDAQLKRAERAERALIAAGYTYKEGAEEWKPPLGPGIRGQQFRHAATGSIVNFVTDSARASDGKPMATYWAEDDGRAWTCEADTFVKDFERVYTKG